LSNLGLILEGQQQHANAEPLLRRALAIYEKTLCGGHQQVATTLDALISLLQATDRLADAEPLLRRALAIDEQFLGTSRRQS